MYVWSKCFDFYSSSNMSAPIFYTNGINNILSENFEYFSIYQTAGWDFSPSCCCFHCSGVWAFLIDRAWMSFISSCSAAFTIRCLSSNLFPSNCSDTISIAKLAPHLDAVSTSTKLKNWKKLKDILKSSKWICPKEETYPPDVSITSWNRKNKNVNPYEDALIKYWKEKRVVLGVPVEVKTFVLKAVTVLYCK